MIPKTMLKTLAEERLEDAKALVDAGRYDTAFYMAGYVIEISLKVRICTTLNWAEFPDTNREFQDYRSFRTHNLEVLLNLSGFRHVVHGSYLTEWSTIASWDPSLRYTLTALGNTGAAKLIKDVEVLMEVLCKS